MNSTTKAALIALLLSLVTACGGNSESRPATSTDDSSASGELRQDLDAVANDLEAMAGDAADDIKREADSLADRTTGAAQDVANQLEAGAKSAADQTGAALQEAKSATEREAEKMKKDAEAMMNNMQNNR